MMKLCVGRRQERREIKEALLNNPIQVVVLTGMGIAPMRGLGKTTLALSLLKELRSHYSHVDVFSGHRLTSESNAYQASFDLMMEGSQKNRGKVKELINMAFSRERNLILLDDVNTLDDLLQILPEDLGKTQFLITTSMPSFSGLLQQERPDLRMATVALPLFEDRETLALFKALLGEAYDPRQEPFYEELGARLGGHPFALRLIGSLMKEEPYRCVAQLVHELKQLDLKGVRGGQVDAERHNLMQIHDLLWDTLDKYQKHMLQFMALCPPGPIPLDLLEHLYGISPKLLRLYLRQLCKLGWSREVLYGKTITMELHGLMRLVLIEKGIDPHIKDSFLDLMTRAYTNMAKPNQLQRNRWLSQGRAVLAMLIEDRDPRLCAWVGRRFFQYCLDTNNEDYFIKIADHVLKLPDLEWEHLMNALTLKAEALNKMDNLEGSLQCLMEKQKVCEQVDARDELADCYMEMACIHTETGRLDEALGLLKKEEALCRQLEKKGHLTICQYNQSCALIYQGRYAEAFDLLKEFEAYRLKLGDQGWLSACYANQAIILNAWGKLDEAKAVLEKHQVIVDDIGDRHGQMSIYCNKAVNLMIRDNHQEALDLLRRQRVLCKQLSDRENLAICLNVMGTVLREMGRLDEAMEAHLEEESLRSGFRSRLWLERCYLNKAETLRVMGSLDEAMAICQEQEKHCLEVGDREGRAIACEQQAIISMEWNNFSRAQFLLEDARRIYEELDLPLRMTHWFWHLANLNQRMGSLTDALQHFREHLALSEYFGTQPRQGTQEHIASLSKQLGDTLA